MLRGVNESFLGNKLKSWQTEYNYRAKIRLPDLTGVRQCKENNRALTQEGIHSVDLKILKKLTHPLTSEETKNYTQHMVSCNWLTLESCYLFNSR